MVDILGSTAANALTQAEYVFAGNVVSLPYDQAEAVMRDRNRFLILADGGRRGDVWVLIEGPRQGEGTVLTLREATAAGLTYRWGR